MTQGNIARDETLPRARWPDGPWLGVLGFPLVDHLVMGVSLIPVDWDFSMTYLGSCVAMGVVGM